MFRRIGLFVFVFVFTLMLSAAISTKARTVTISSGFQFCAAEGDACRMTGPGSIVFGGTDGGYTDPISLFEDFACTRANFGNSAPDAQSACYVKYDTSAPEPTPAPTPAGLASLGFPQPYSLLQLPAGWSGTTIVSLDEPALAPAQCQRSNGVAPHAVVATGFANGQAMTYTICETDTTVIGWFEIKK